MAHVFFFPLRIFPASSPNVYNSGHIRDIPQYHGRSVHDYTMGRLAHIPNGIWQSDSHPTNMKRHQETIEWM